MKLVSLELKEWRSFKECQLDFPDGLIGVRGPNGSGKSTIAEAIAWALFGKPRPGAKVADLKRQGAEGPSSVELTFRVGPTVYRVKRVVGGAATFWIGDGTEPESTQTTHTNQAIVRELGIGHDSFQRTVFARQKDVAALDPGATKNARTQHVERLLGLQRYRDAAAAAKQGAKEIGVKVAALREQAPDLAALRAELADAEAVAAGSDPAVVAAESALATARALAAEAEAAHEVERRRVSTNDRLVEQRDGEQALINEIAGDLAAREAVAAARDKKQRRHDELAALPIDLDEVRSRVTRWQALADAHAALAACEDPSALGYDPAAAARDERRLASVRSDLEALTASVVPDLAGMKRRILALEDADGLPAADDAARALAAAEARRDAARDRAAALRSRLASDEAHLTSLEERGADAPCPVCLRPYGEADFGAIRAAHEQQLVDGRSALAEVERECSALEAERARLNEVRTRVQQAQAKLDAAPGLDDLAEARAALKLADRATRVRTAALDELRKEQETLAPAVAAAADLERRFTTARALHEAARERVQTAAAELGVEHFDPAALDSARADLDSQTAANDELRELAASLAASAGITTEIETLEQRRARRTETLATITAELAALALVPGRLHVTAQARAAAGDEVTEASEALNDARVRAHTSSSAVVELRRRVDEAEAAHAAIALLVREHREHETAAQLLADFRAAQSARAWPNLEQGASRLLSDTTDGRYADVRMSDDYRLEIIDRGERFGLDRFSGGEQDLANLCLRLAIADWVARERDTELGFVVLDEVFGSQDEDRRGRLLDALRSFERRFHQLLVITHVPEVAEVCDHQLVVRLLEPGLSAAAFE